MLWQQQHEGLQIMQSDKKKKPLKRGADMLWEDDTLGSYTGICFNDKDDTPVQDADDL